MAQAIMELYPNETVQLGIGPVIEHGFYYDVDMESRLTDDDLEKIEKKMLGLIDQDHEIKRHEIKKADAIKMFADQGQGLKVELITDFDENEVISYYTQGNKFMDLCTGPHVERTSHLPKHFKLLHTAGAYWRGDEKRPMLQRIYAASFSDRKQLKKHLNFLVEAKKRDHRKLGKELELFIFDPVAPGSPFFMPKGALIYNQLIEFMRRIYVKFDYKEVITPQILDASLWKTSGHYEHYKDDMFFSHDDHHEYAVKPMNCPCHMLMFGHFKYSYRDLPLRYADFGRLHRNEKSGALAGLTRVRTFCQDDAHIFIAQEEIQDEIKKLLDMFKICYEHFGFENLKIGLSTRPEKKAGSDEDWDSAEKALEAALKSSNVDYTIEEGDGAFYGPKIDVQVSDAIGRFYQLGTVQLDFQLPQRFNLKFTNSSGVEERPVVIHRALLGSLERFIGIFIEHTGGAFPFWIAPEQAVIVPVNNDAHLEYANDVCNQLNALGLRVRVDSRNESMGYKTRQIITSKVPFLLVVGDKEIEAKAVNVRKYGEKKSESVTMEDIKQIFMALDSEKIPAKLITHS
jgi:threonyl-tRNA synthetase